MIGETGFSGRGSVSDVYGLGEGVGAGIAPVPFTNVPEFQSPIVWAWAAVALAAIKAARQKVTRVVVRKRAARFILMGFLGLACEKQWTPGAVFRRMQLCKKGAPNCRAA